MSRKFFSLLAMLFVAASASLLWAKWRRENPPPTPLDLAARQRLIGDENAFVRVATSRGTRIFYLSRQDREDIAAHLWIIAKTPTVMSYAGEVEVYWKSEKIALAPNLPDDCYQADDSTPQNDTFLWYSLHPATSLFLRRWFATRPNIALYISQMR